MANLFRSVKFIILNKLLTIMNQKKIIVDKRTGLILTTIAVNIPVPEIDKDFVVITINSNMDFFHNINRQNLENYFLTISKKGLDLLLDNEIEIELKMKKTNLLSVYGE